jgi:hypothetical protein
LDLGLKVCLRKKNCLKISGLGSNPDEKQSFFILFFAKFQIWLKLNLKNISKIQKNINKKSPLL